MALKLVGRSRPKPVFVDADAVIAILPVDTNHRPTPTADTIVLLNRNRPYGVRPEFAGSPLSSMTTEENRRIRV